MRLLVEPAAARFAATRATLDDIALIRASCDAMRLSMADMAAYAQADVQFHMAVLHASQNAMLRHFGHTVANFLQISFRLQQETLDVNEDLIENDCANHVKIYDAINRNDPATAESSMLEVVLHGKASLQKSAASNKILNTTGSTRNCGMHALARHYHFSAATDRRNADSARGLGR
jgi:GntR family transcriptional regulator, galactonate operon transcriptional repressor